ncbi:MAG: hypothetical protein AAFO69_10020 [Bacteroidota bacterium]
MLILVLVLTCVLSIKAQNPVQEKLSEAESAFGSGNLEEARFALQQSLVELDIVVGEAILKQLPMELSGLTANKEDDEMTGGAAGLTGVYVQRFFTGETQNIDVEVVTNSPFMSIVNASLTNPLIVSMSGGNQSVVKIDGYKSLLQKEDDSDDGEFYQVSIPINDSMIILKTEGFSKNEAISIANSLGIRAIAKLIGATQ